VVVAGGGSRTEWGAGGGSRSEWGAAAAGDGGEAAWELVRVGVGGEEEEVRDDSSSARESERARTAQRVHELIDTSASTACEASRERDASRTAQRLHELIDRLEADLAAQVLFTPQFTCFTSTKVQIQRLHELIDRRLEADLAAQVLFTTQFTCFTSTKVQILTADLAAPSVPAGGGEAVLRRRETGLLFPWSPRRVRARRPRVAAGVAANIISALINVLVC
jgi:hypothetical protein